QAGSIIVEPAPTPRVDRRIEATQRGADGGTGVIQADSLLVFGSEAVIEADAFEVRPGGVVGGTGPFPVGFVRAGTVAPADTASATATFAVAGDYAQTAEGVLEIELAGTAE